MSWENVAVGTTGKSPRRCFISSKCHNLRLSCNPRGQLNTKASEQREEEWCVLPIAGSDGIVLVFFQSVAHRTFLRSSPSGRVGTCGNGGGQSGWDKWRLTLSPHGYFLVSHLHGKRLSCNDKGQTYTIDRAGRWETWSIESIPAQDRACATTFSMRNHSVFLPCLERPARCFLSSVEHDLRLSSLPTDDGGVTMTRRRESQEEWQLIPVSGKNINIQSSCHHSHLLNSTPNGAVGAYTKTDNKWDEWRIERAAPGGRGWGYSIVATAHDEKQLTCDAAGNCYTADDHLDGDNNNQRWNIEFQTGELCFISSSSAHEWRLQCQASGSVRMKPSWKGRGVWRFVEVGDESVFISSVKYDKKFLCSDPHGRVFTTSSATDRNNYWNKWTVRKDLSREDDTRKDIIICSVASGKVLSLTVSNKLVTEDICEANNKKWQTGWQLEAAHCNNFFLCSEHHKKGMSIRDNGCLIMTSDHEKWKKWRFHAAGNNGLFEVCCLVDTNRRLGSSSDGNVFMTTGPATEREKWRLDRCSRGLFIVSDAHDRHLACDDDDNDNKGALYTVAGLRTESDAWNLKPLLPVDIAAGITTVAPLTKANTQVDEICRPSNDARVTMGVFDPMGSRTRAFRPFCA